MSIRQPNEHQWFIPYRVGLWLIFASLILSTILIVWILMVTYAIRRDCESPYDRTFETKQYWITIKAGSMEVGCPNNEGVYINESE